jgi:hypothetical protein
MNSSTKLVTTNPTGRTDGVTDVRQLEDAKRRALSKKWSYVARLCREAAEAASLYEDPERVRRLLLRAARHTTEAERLARTVGVVQAYAEDSAAVNTTNWSTKSTTNWSTTGRTAL